jgi:hypothetical protein
MKTACIKLNEHIIYFKQDVFNGNLPSGNINTEGGAKELLKIGMSMRPCT